MGTKKDSKSAESDLDRQEKEVFDAWEDTAPPRIEITVTVTSAEGQRQVIAKKGGLPDKDRLLEQREAKDEEK